MMNNQSCQMESEQAPPTSTSRSRGDSCLGLVLGAWSRTSYYVRASVIAIAVFGGIWALSGIILAISLQEYQVGQGGVESYKCWICVKNCPSGQAQLEDYSYCKGDLGQIGYDVGTVNSWLSVVFGPISCITSFFMFFSIIRTAALRRNIMAFLLGMMALCDILYALNFLVFGSIKIASNEYPYEPTKVTCNALGFLGQTSSVSALVFYTGFSIMTGLLVKAPFFFDRLQKSYQARTKCLLGWIVLAVIYAITTSVVALKTDSIGVTSDGTCWFLYGMEWTFYAPMIVTAIYSIVLLVFLGRHRVESANTLARKYFAFILAFLVYNSCGIILTLLNIGQYHPIRHGWGSALLETSTVISTVLQGFFNALVYHFLLKVKKDNGVAANDSTPDTLKQRDDSPESAVV